MKDIIKAPSQLGLRALRFIAFPEVAQPCLHGARRHYATPPPPPIQSPPSDRPAVRAINSPLLTQSPRSLRGRKDDDPEFQPQPLARPIGMHSPPRPGDNMGIDRRNLAQKREDFVNYDKHLEKRAQMRKEISKPYFRDWSNLRFHKGKMFTSNEKLFRGEYSLWFPNFFGKTLHKESARAVKDGYGGQGRDSCTAMDGKVSVVSILSSQWAQGQVDTFCSAKQNPELDHVLQSSKDVAQRIWIHYEPNTLRWWLIQLFKGNLRRGKSVEEQKRYFMVRRGVSEEMKESIGLLNESVGYVYLVDQECRIRWAGNAVAEPAERESMVRGLKRLIEEARKAPKRSSGAQKHAVGPRMPLPAEPKSL